MLPSSVPRGPAGASQKPGPSPSSSAGANSAPIQAHDIAIATSDIRLPASLSRAVAVAMGGSVLVCGGMTRSGATTGAILRINLATHEVVVVGRLSHPVHDAGGAGLRGSAIVLGGGRSGPGVTVQRVDGSGQSSVIGQLPARRADLAAVSVGDELLVVGGGTPAHPDARVLATTDGSGFRIVATLKIGVRYAAVAALNGLVFVVGGTTGSADVGAIQVIDPVAGTVKVIGRLPESLSHATALVVGGRLLIAGGRHGGRAQDTIWQLDTRTGVVTRVGRLPRPLSDAAAAAVGGVGYLIGGEANVPVASIISLTAR